MFNTIKKLTKLIGAFLSSSLLLMVVQCKKSSNDDSTLIALLFTTKETETSVNTSITEGCAQDNLRPISYRNVALFNNITESPGATNCGFGDPKKAINGVRGAGKTSGSLDVYSLKSSSSSTYCKPNERCIVLEVENKKVINGIGIDFVIFENGFCNGGENNCGISHFMETIIVEVSYDGTNWCGWNPQYTGDTSASSLRNPNNWQRFAGIWPVIYNQDTWAYLEDDIFDRNKAGGDGFDLSDPEFGNSGDGCNTTIKNQILTSGFIYLRLTSANSRGFTYDSNSFDQMPDIDGAIARYVQNR